MFLKTLTKGHVEIKTGKVDITDPCYKKDTWCRINDVPLKKGVYRCRYYVGDRYSEEEIERNRQMAKEFGRDIEKTLESMEKDIQGRCFVIELQLKGRAFQLNSKKWECIGEIGVDAGLAGFFWNKPDFTDDEWDDFCDSMDDEQPVYLDEKMGFWSTSGYGDGSYEVFAIKEKGEIIALKIEF